MKFIIGGSYQGKLDFARQEFSLTDSDIFICTPDTEEIDFSKKCIAYIDKYALNRIRAGIEPADTFKINRDMLSDVVIISNDVSCGIVPIETDLRAWREACGRMNNYLARESDEVWRLFCGLPQKIK
ncbi:MAG: bifunctional adenosylcobinamide kinase/adenosylcobinamide-phosphate guanylyltransferase [Clostridia bacterium]|nr:bifunctional adenosylcobinamide kinase/adenosylcobinamide-phosphate guanylyltransferase [Clostridia bacterium]